MPRAPEGPSRAVAIRYYCPMPAEHSIYIPNPDGTRTTIPLPPSDHPPEVVLQAIALHGETGSYKATGETLGVSQVLVKKWVTSEAGTQIASALRDTLRAQFAYRYRCLLDKALTVAMERLEHGDVTLDRRGVARAVPVKARDAALIASIAQDKYLALTGTIDANAQTGKLAALAERLEKASVKLLKAELAPTPEGGSRDAAEGGEGENNNEGNFA